MPDLPLPEELTADLLSQVVVTRESWPGGIFSGELCSGTSPLPE